ncbi:MAG: leucine-rich repeat protein, partial [Oscillospiraceae bacterium]|nr:leucine-rich repeat protein [Oscillospiraceae bacterium]
SQFESITLPDSIFEIRAGAFENSRLKNIRIPADTLLMGKNVFLNCSELQAVDVDKANICYKSIGGVLYDKTGSELICYPAGRKSHRFSVPEGVSRIGQAAFCRCTELYRVILPKTLMSIGSEAFASSGLKAVTVPENVENVEAFAFGGCTLLDSITFMNSAPDYDGYMLCYDETDSYHYNGTVYVPDEAQIEYTVFTVSFGYNIRPLSEKPVSGDVAGNGKLTAESLVMIARYLIGDYVLTEQQKILADTDLSGDVTVSDLMFLVMVLTGKANGE